MELYERVKQVAKIIGISDKALGAELGLKQTTFSGYLNKRREHNLWPLLPKILELHPEISRQWLYFGEEETDTASAEKIARLEAELAEERALNRKLTNRLLLVGGDNADSSASAGTASGRG